MFRLKGTMSVILVVALAVGCATTNPLMKEAEEASQSEREAMYDPRIVVPPSVITSELLATYSINSVDDICGRIPSFCVEV